MEVFGRSGLGALAASAVVVAWLLASTLFGFLPDTFHERRRMLAERRAAYQWIARSLPPDSGFVAYDDALLYLYAGRPAASLRVPTRLYYQQDLEGLLARHTAVDEFARPRGLRYLLTATDDYFRGEVPLSVRARVRQSVAHSYAGRRVYATAAVSIYDLARP